MRRKGKISWGRIKRPWPDHVAIIADRPMGKNYNEVHGFANKLSVAPRPFTRSSRAGGRGRITLPEVERERDSARRGFRANLATSHQANQMPPRRAKCVRRGGGDNVATYRHRRHGNRGSYHSAESE
jgi:hypothetical protein